MSIPIKYFQFHHLDRKQKSPHVVNQEVVVCFSERFFWQTLQILHVHRFSVDPRFIGQDAFALLGGHRLALAMLEGQLSRGLTQAGDHVTPVRVCYGYGSRTCGEQRALNERQAYATLGVILDEVFV